MFLSKISGKNYGKENFIFSKKLKCACVLGGGWMVLIVFVHFFAGKKCLIYEITGSQIMIFFVMIKKNHISLKA